jgi:hypothetical protein
MKCRPFWCVLCVTVIVSPLSAQNDYNTVLSKRLEKLADALVSLLDSNVARSMVMNMTSPRAAFGTTDGGVIIISANKMTKYDKDLNLKKEVVLSIDSAAIKKSLPKNPSPGPDHNGTDSSSGSRH